MIFMMECALHIRACGALLMEALEGAVANEEIGAEPPSLDQAAAGTEPSDTSGAPTALEAVEAPGESVGNGGDEEIVGNGEASVEASPEAEEAESSAVAEASLDAPQNTEEAEPSLDAEIPSQEAEEAPQEAEEAPQEAEEAPQEAEEAPQEAEAAPQEAEGGAQEEAAPQEAEEAPQEAEEAPQEAEEAPQEAEAAPQEAEEAPQEAEEAPQEAEGGAQEEEAPQDEEAPQEAEEAPQEAEGGAQEAEAAPQEAEQVPEGETPEVSADGSTAPVAAVAAPAHVEKEPPAALPQAKQPVDDQVEIKFIIVPEGFSHSRKFSWELSLPEVKTLIEQDLRIPVANMKLVFDGKELTSGRLLDFGFARGQINQVELQIVYLEERSAPTSYVMPDVISVEVNFGADIPPKVIQVPIVRATPDKKPFLGGFRSRKTRLEFHHATSQTDPRPNNDVVRIDKFHRETQTAVLQTRSQQSVREQGTQMPSGHLMIEEGDEVILPLPYFDSEQLAELRLEKAIDLQRYTRGWFARAVATSLLRAQQEAYLKAAEIEEAQRRAAEERHAKEIERRMHPHVREDFEILYNELEAWRLQETRRINGENLLEPERMAALSQLLLKEQKLLQTIDRLRLQANDENRDKRIRSTLQLMAAPKRWQMSDGEVAQVHTPFTTRAKELMELYNGLRLPSLSIDERLDVLLHVKWTVKEFDCNLTRDIVELIDREADMLNRGRSEESLQGLRTRLANLFLQFIETPEFNPESGRFQKVPEVVLRPNVRPVVNSTTKKL